MENGVGNLSFCMKPCCLTLRYVCLLILSHFILLHYKTALIKEIKMASFWYHERHKKSYPSAKFILGEIKRIHDFKSAADLGCGVGTWLFTAKEFGAVEVKGLDGSKIAPEHLKITANEFENFDLNNPLSLNYKYDLAISLEVAEHINGSSMDNYFNLLTSLSSFVLFSGAFPGQGGKGHINEQEPSYWIKQFNKRGFKLYDVIRPIIWEKDDLLLWYKQNCLIFVKENELPEVHATLSKLEDWKGRYIIHPDYFKKFSFITKLRDPIQFAKSIFKPN